MRLKNLKNKIVCFLLVISISLQSCSVYKKTPVTLDEAVTANRKVLIVKADNTKVKFIRIEQIDGIYYGELKIKGRTEKIPLTESDLKKIRILDKTATTIGNVAIILVSAGGVILIVGLIELSNWSSDFNFGGPGW